MLSLAAAWSITAGVCLVAVGYLAVLGKMGLVKSVAARKAMHVGTGPTFLLCWCLFPASPWAPYVASSVICLITSVFVAVGLGVVELEDLVGVVSRNGHVSELLQGPLLYGIAHVLATVLYWFNVPTGFVIIQTLCFGDGLAEVFGRNFGAGNPLPWNRGKSIVGSLAFWLAAYLSCLCLAAFYFQHGFIDEKYREGFGAKCAMVVTVGALAESFSVGQFDNMVIFFACAVVGKLVW